MSKPVRIGILGAARIAPPAVIAPARDDSEFEVVAVAARDPAKAQAFAQAQGVPHVAADYAALVRRDDVDLVYNALPPAAHAAWSIAALKAGKAVLCEKPFTRNADEAHRLVAAATQAGGVLIEAFHYRFHAVIRRAEAIVRAGEIGPIETAEAVFDAPIPMTPDELRWSRALGGGALMDLGTYCVHALRTLIGAEPRVVRAQAEVRQDVDARMSAELAFGAAQAKIACSMIAPKFAARLVLQGAAGRLEIENFIAPQFGSRMTVTTAAGARAEPTAGPSTYAAQLRHVGDVLLRGAPPLTGGADAVAQMAAIDAVYAAAGMDRTFQTEHG
ncbi:MAG: Gfo/Idh/MocA family oxidoreductase [Alphaproteobacteria bacterium]|nr:Gfo/Idh/MocA family oxidoreductase [Alphaproteobacteria bacterium]